MMLGEESAESEATLECLEEASSSRWEDRILVLSLVDGVDNRQVCLSAPEEKEKNPTPSHWFTKPFLPI